MKLSFGKMALVVALLATVGGALETGWEREPLAGSHDPIRLSRPLRSSGDPGIRDMPVVGR